MDDGPIIIERKKLFEHVAAHLEAQILSGKLRPGDQLTPEAIYAGIVARDPDRAEAAMRQHLRQPSTTYWRQRGDAADA